MQPGALDPHDHRGCRAAVGELHERGCDVERCARCGGQAIACPCVYELNGMNPSRLEEDHPDIYHDGPTEEMVAVYDAEIERLGGRIPRGPLYPGTEDCVRLNLWCRWVESGTEEAVRLGRAGWHKCDREHPDAVPDLNELGWRARWNPRRRRYESAAESLELGQ